MHRLHPIESFETARARKALRIRGRPYHLVLSPCLALGFHRYARKPCKWFARYRGLDGKYVRKELGLAESEFPSPDVPSLTFEQARKAAQEWFDTPEIRAVSGRGNNYVAAGTSASAPSGMNTPFPTLWPTFSTGGASSDQIAITFLWSHRPIATSCPPWVPFLVPLSPLQMSAPYLLLSNGQPGGPAEIPFAIRSILTV